MMRIATKYPRIAERYFEQTGRQVEVIEVKGSVELAPLIGLADGIVDLVATGRTLEENDLEVREEIVELHRPLRRQPRRPQAARRRGRRADREAEREAAGRAMRVARLRVGGRRPRLGSQPRCALGPRPRPRSRSDVSRDRARCASGGDGAVLELTARFDGDGAAEGAAGPGRRRRSRRCALDPSCARRCESPRRTSAPSPRPSSPRSRRRSSCPRARPWRSARVPVGARRRSTRRAAGPPTRRAC